MPTANGWLVPRSAARELDRRKTYCPSGCRRRSEAFDAGAGARGRTAIILCLAEDDGQVVLSQHGLGSSRICRVSRIEMDVRSRIVAHGRPSGLVALDQARRLIAAGDVQLRHYRRGRQLSDSRGDELYLADSRLLAPEQPNGFIPGEAAAACLRAHTSYGGPELTGLGLAREQAFIYNEADLPLRGDGMTTAYRQRCTRAGIEMNQLGFRISDLIGEQYWFKQTALASLRLCGARMTFRTFGRRANRLAISGLPSCR